MNCFDRWSLDRGSINTLEVILGLLVSLLSIIFSLYICYRTLSCVFYGHCGPLVVIS